MAAKPTLDPVTFEVLKNSFITSVDQMAEQILRTCYSFVIYNRDFSSALHDANGNSAAQGNQDIAVHVGTLHFTCKDVMRAFESDMNRRRLCDQRSLCAAAPFSRRASDPPIFADGEIIAFSQSNGHWSDVGGSVPGSFDVTARACSARGCASRPCVCSTRGASAGTSPISSPPIHAIRPRSSATSTPRRRRPRYVSGKYFGSSANTAARRSRPACPRCRIMWSAPCANASRRCRTAFGRRRTSSTATPRAPKG